MTHDYPFLTNDRLIQTEERIIGFGDLPQGWHYGEGIPSSKDTIEKALRLNREARKAGFSKTNAFPGIEGEIQVTVYHGAIYLEFTIERDGKITYIQEQDDTEVVYEQNLFLLEAIDRIARFGGITWPLSGFFITSTMTPTKSDSKVLPSSPPAMEAVSPSSIETVSSKEVPVFASISQDFTGIYLGTPQSSGRYHPDCFLSIVSSFNKPAQLTMIATTT